MNVPLQAPHVSAIAVADARRSGRGVEQHLVEPAAAVTGPRGLARFVVGDNKAIGFVNTHPVPAPHTAAAGVQAGSNLIDDDACTATPIGTSAELSPLSEAS